MKEEFWVWQLGGGWLTALLCGVVGMMEVVFYVYCQYKIQRYNEQIHSIPYRDYPKESDRKQLLQSLLNRISNVTTFLQSWSTSHKKKEEDDIWMDTLLDCMGDTQGVITSLPSLERSYSIDTDSCSSSSSSSSSSDGYRNVAEFLSWALYHESYERKQEVIQDMMTDMIGPKLNVPHDWSFFEQDKLCCMSFEPLNVWHRPLLFYIALAFLRYCTTTLFLQSFTKVTTQSHFTYYWYKNKNAKKTIVFFHGIAPGGITLYLPFLYHTILQSCQDVNILLVELDVIASCIPMSSKFELEEQQTVQEILDALYRHSLTSTSIVLVGHSFGSCPITWLVQSKHFCSQCIIDSVLLLEPVSILLSEPHVMTNFLYSTSDKMTIHQFIIRCMASCELGIQSYLRRQFAWYNCEYQIPPTIPTIVCLAGKDTIVPSTMIQSELTKYKNVTTHYFEDEGHGGCITKPYLWSQIHQILQTTIHSKKRTI